MVHMHRTIDPDRLYLALLSLRTSEECQAFLDDILTPGEFEDVVQRLEVAHVLSEGGTYESAAERTGASATTISRVRRALFRGAGGYRTVLERIGRA
ncbi:TrpR like protein [mine drainage metagenome]|uniref:TrpR like protein n=1 Tax=mine drainage metagenome TaxID=410659 RepID=T1BAR6_9ZZZZ